MFMLFFFLVLCSTQGNQGNDDAKRLYDDLINGYNSLIRPVGNNSDRLTVKMGLRLSQLIDVTTTHGGSRTFSLRPASETLPPAHGEVQDFLRDLENEMSVKMKYDDGFYEEALSDCSTYYYEISTGIFSPRHSGTAVTSS
ncbi:Acetylcholine receptor subunit alpha-like 1 [Araneus ventricosus]|uniref:Acetylcholine receptor subunit alpha-like 1 n=1 Tax=Araneus ventricosus TaxID=182803 RepID=A0A4Y2R4L6_ARAVE|nr:Acetylcholine receptor subunit alpha-like 1 [Araneus ventricosus]